MALGLADVDRQPRLAAGAVEVDRVGAAAAAAGGQVEAREAVVELAREAGGGAGEALVVLGRDDHRDLGGDLAVVGAGQRAGRQRAQRPHRQDQHPLAPLAALRGPRRRPQDEHAGAAVEIGAELGARGRRCRRGRSPRGRGRRRRRRSKPPRWPTPAPASAPARAPAASSPCGRSPGPAASGRGSAAPRPRRRRPAARRLVTPSPPESSFCSWSGRGPGDREDRAGAVDQGDAGAQQAGGGAGDRGQAGARLDRFGERVEKHRIPGLCRAFSPL